jgi:hypothetical protein
MGRPLVNDEPFGETGIAVIDRARRKAAARQYGEGRTRVDDLLRAHPEIVHEID